MKLIPTPKKVTTTSDGGSLTLSYTGEICLEGSCLAADYEAAKFLQEAIKKHLGFSWGITRQGKGDSQNFDNFILNQGFTEKIRLRNRGNKKEGLPASLCRKEDRIEAYELHIQEKGIEIAGESSAGLWYGVQTFCQLLQSEGAVLPFVLIEDEPEIQNRGFYHDVTRGRIPKLEELKRLVDKMAYYKLNQLQLYVEHSFLFQGFSEVWRDDTPLTAEDILELDQYCAKRHIELVPSLSSFGHLYKVLSTKTYAELCELPDSDKAEFSFPGRMAHHTVDVSNHRSFELVKQMIEEFLPLFSSRHFNLCADETFDLGTGKSRGTEGSHSTEDIEKEDERAWKQRLYMGFLKKTCQLIVSHDRIPMFWGDIICDFPEAVQELPEGTICLNWGYAPNQSEDGIRALAEAGAIQYACPGVQGWNNLVNDNQGAYENIKQMCQYACRYGAVGVLNTDWGDFGHINHPDFSTVGMIYGAAFSWNPEIPDREVINPLISVLEYGDRSGRFVDLVSELHGCSVFSWFFAVIWKETRQGLLSGSHPWFSLDRVKWDRLEEAKDRLAGLKEQLYQMPQELSESNRSRIYAYLLAAEGIHLWNQVGEVVRYRQSQEEAGIMDLSLHREYPLAEELEHWYQRYKELWRTVSRESELYRISEVIAWYGDYLRER